MSILVGKETRLICQGLGKAGIFHCSKCVEYGTHFVGSVKPGQEGNTFSLPNSSQKYPYFNTVESAVKSTKANTSIIFVPAPFAADAIMEAVDAGIALVVCITEGIPILDMIRVKAFMKGRNSCLIGPNCPGIITPGQSKIGIMPGYIHKPGNIGVISRSGTLTYETVWQLTELGLGQSTCIGIGGDQIIGSTFVDILEKFQQDDETQGVVLIGEIGGDMELQAAQYIHDHFHKPVTAFIAGQTAPAGKRMGHAGAIIHQGEETAAYKMKFLKEHGVHVVVSPAEIGKTMQKAMNQK